MRANSPRRTAKAAQVTSKDRQDNMKAMKMINAMDSQNRGLNRILNRRSPFVGNIRKISGRLWCHHVFICIVTVSYNCFFMKLSADLSGKDRRIMKF